MTHDRRVVQTSTAKLFGAIKKYAQDVPVLVIATKKDEFEDMKSAEAQRNLQRRGQVVNAQLLEDANRSAQEKLKTKLEEIQDEILGVDGGRFDACVAVSKGEYFPSNPYNIANLVENLLEILTWLSR